MDTRTRIIETGKIRIGAGCPLALIAGPCVIEDPETTFRIASELKEMTGRRDMPFIFKASYDKANRTSITSFRGPRLVDGLRVLANVKERLGVPVLSDVHQVSEVKAAAEVLDVIQIPAFLCRQTDLLTAVAETGKPVNVKKGQFLSPWDMEHVAAKITATGNEQVLVTERGAMFGYNNLVVDMRGIEVVRRMGWPVVFDATHSVQLPGGAGGSSGGKREFAPVLARAAVAAGADAVFIETHFDPDKALCDGPNSLPLDELPDLLDRLAAIRRALL